MDKYHMLQCDVVDLTLPSAMPRSRVFLGKFQAFLVGHHYNTINTTTLLLTLQYVQSNLPQLRAALALPNPALALVSQRGLRRATLLSGRVCSACVVGRNTRAATAPSNVVVSPIV